MFLWIPKKNEVIKDQLCHVTNRKVCIHMELEYYLKLQCQSKHSEKVLNKLEMIDRL